MSTRRYWAAVVIMLMCLAIALPLGRVTHTLLADLQTLYVAALLALLARLVLQASTGGPGPPAPAGPGQRPGLTPPPVDC